MPENTRPNAPELPERIPKLTFGALFVANMAAMLGLGILLPIFTPFAKQLGATATLAGIIFAGFAFSRGLLSPFFGRLSDKYGRTSLILLGLGLYVLLSLGYIFVQGMLLLAILWFLQGISTAMITPIAQSYIGDITPKGKEGRIMNLFYLGQFGGVAVGPVIGGYLADHFSFSAPFYAMGTAAIIGFMLVYFGVPELQFFTSNEHEHEDDRSFIASFTTVINDYKIRGILSYMIGRGFYRWGFNAFFPVYAVTTAALTKSQVGIVISSYMITGTLLQYPFGRLADRYPDKRADLIALGGGVAAMTMFFVPLILHLSWLITLVIVMGIFSAVSRASTIAIRTERGRIYGMGAVTGVYTSGFSAGQVLGPVGFGIITDALNIPASFYIGAIAGLFSTALAYWFLKFKAGSSV